MKKSNLKSERGFTLIELIAVLVILTILALIVTPLVLNIIKKAKMSVDKRSIDAYGHSIELAVVSYLLENNLYPSSIEQLQIEYTGNKVECETTTLRDDGSVYLARCKVAGRSVENYTYGKAEEESSETYESYSVGDKVSYNNVTYYVIEDSDQENDSIKLLKEIPLLKTEMDALNIIDVTIGESNSYGTVQYGTTADYTTSIVKNVVDAWKVSQAPAARVARLITYDELQDNLGYNHGTPEASWINVNPEYTPSWVYNSNYYYFTMSQYQDYSSLVWIVSSDGIMNDRTLSQGRMVRPVIELLKSNDITKIS